MLFKNIAEQPQISNAKPGTRNEDVILITAASGTYRQNRLIFVFHPSPGQMPCKTSFHGVCACL
jgi:hypothetical protein